MKLEQKHILLIVGAVLIATAIGVGIYLLVRKDDKPDETKDNPPPGDNSGGSQGNANGSQPGNAPSSYTPPPTVNTSGKVVPIYNEEKELDNPFSQLRGRVLYPKRKSAGGWDYANVRTSAEVNTEQAWYDPFDNLLTTINSGTPIGRVLEEVAGVYNGYSYRWFKVDLIKSVGFWGTKTGYVRGDTVTFVPYDK